MIPATRSSAVRARTALRIGRPRGRASASRPAISRTTNGARLCVISRSGVSPSMSALASATPRIPTNATNQAAAARPTGQTRLSPRRIISGTSSATSRIGLAPPPSSISQPACFCSAPSAFPFPISHFPFSMQAGSPRRPATAGRRSSGSRAAAGTRSTRKTAAARRAPNE